ncbi:solute carrier family 22 member 3-like isoform X2 [Lineus longissimus]|uniref:solute carrier family 22 member 3-like isoform X2 n=1 Tax=Lineus longissimus TaxID=88925 RepID=UPI00315CD30C
MEDLDKVLGRLGGYGRWQLYVYTLWCTFSMATDCFQDIVYNFTGGVPEHHCRVPENLTSTVSNVGKCKLYFNTTGEETSCIYGMEYPDKNFGQTIVTEWDLVCEQNFYAELSQTLYTIGTMVGSMAISPLSDMFGRKTVHLGAQVLTAIISTASALVPNYAAFVVLRTLSGVVAPGAILTGIIASCEVFAAKQRTFAGQFIYFWWVVYLLMLGGLAYALPNWRHLVLALSLIPLFSLVGIWLLPESIPWLVANNRIEEAEEILRDAAKMNKLEVPDHPLAKLILPLLKREDSDMGTDSVVLYEKNQEAEGSEVAIKQSGNMKKRGGFMNTLKEAMRRRRSSQIPESTHEKGENLIAACRRHKIVLKNLIMLCFLWFANGLVYYGMALSSTSLAGDRFLNYFLNALAELPSVALCVWMLQKFGRRWPICLFHILVGLSLGFLVFIPTETADGTNLIPLVITMNVIGRFAITFTFNALIMYSLELFPTNARNSGLGVASFFGRIAGCFAPFTTLLLRLSTWLPGVIFGVVSLIGGLCVLFLTETVNKPLPEHAVQIKNWHNEQSFFPCLKRKNVSEKDLEIHDPKIEL